MRAVRFDIQDIAEANPRGYHGHKTKGSIIARYMNEIASEAYGCIRERYPITFKLSFLTPSGRMTGFIADGEELKLPKAIKDLSSGKASLTIYLSDEDEELHNEIASLVPEPVNK
ncbi:MAG: hypothetical protein HY512_02445 [Candidatus Aenigmarchaeota archaeon]|nr:hypothetical protein [Candidatus Aenigmarchaeota archaeon]